MSAWAAAKELLPALREYVRSLPAPQPPGKREEHHDRLLLAIANIGPEAIPVLA